MHPKGKLLINQALKHKEIKGLDLSCHYRPCHEELEDCTFCYCPFYPCCEPDSEGFEIMSKRNKLPIWACNNCILPHRSENAQMILDDLVELGTDFDHVTSADLSKIRAKLIQSHGE